MHRLEASLLPLAFGRSEIEDLNYLLHREQTELLLAAHASNSGRKFSHLDSARGFAVRISGHPLPYRSPSMSGKIGFDPGRFGASPKPVAKFSRAYAK